LRSVFDLGCQRFAFTRATRAWLLHGAYRSIKRFSRRKSRGSVYYGARLKERDEEVCAKEVKPEASDHTYRDK
jgi:hypothetical protein